ncbi:MAG: sorbosone dehydrogenase family protein [Pseudomonadota bacterium]|nr:sorbosone dehydrogenase family protein [Pseudomonadota bacterium]
MMQTRAILAGLLLCACAACGERAQHPESAGFGAEPVLPEPEPALIPTVDIAPAAGWPAERTPQATAGLTVTAFAQGLDHPRWLHVLPNGDVLVAESNQPADAKGHGGVKGWVMGKVMKKAGAGVPSADRISLLRDADGDGVAEHAAPFLENLHSPFGMALVGDRLYVANTDAVVWFPYEQGATRIDAEPTPLAPLPAGPRNHHWTKSLIASPDGERLFATVGSNSNVAEHGMEEEQGRAAIWEILLPGGDHRIYASGLRNPNGMAWVPDSGELWVAVNERDEIGGDLVPDYMTVVHEGGFYGWPYSYYGDHVDPRVEPQRPDLVREAIVPDYALGAHTASLGLAWSPEDGPLPAALRGGMFVGQHGAWNRTPPSGYKVIFVPFRDGRPDGKPVDVLRGFLSPDGDAYGRPVGVAIDSSGALLVADDVGNTVWRVAPAAP